MYAIEFEAPIENGVVHIPKEYKELQQNLKAKFVVIYDSANNVETKNDNVKSQLEEFRKLRALSKNKVTVTMDTITNIDEEMCDDGLF